MSLAQRLELRLKQEPTLQQKLRLEAKILNLRLQLIGKVHDEEYQPHATCPQCDKKLTPLQIIKGFKRDENDYTTKCPRCRHRFEPKIICTRATGATTLQFFCSSQTLGQLHGKEKLSPAEIQKDFPALYQSALAHFGGLTQAFQKNGVNYGFPEPTIPQWEKKVK